MYRDRKKTIIIFLGLIGILDTIFAAGIGSGVNVGIIAPGLMGFILIVWVYLRKMDFYQSVMNKCSRVVKMVKVLLLLWLLSFIFIELLIISGLLGDKKADNENILILGASLIGDTPSLTLSNRLDMGVKVLKYKPNAKVIVSGGQGPGESITEADGMKRYLILKGISENRIIKEDKATSTMENLIYSKKILDKLEGNKRHGITIITSEFHAFRTKFLAERVGLDPNIIISQSPYYLWPNNFIREYFAVVKSYFLDKLVF